MFNRLTTQEKDIMMNITLSAVAEKAGVSTATVSYVLNNRRLNRISDKTRREVLKTVKKMNYSPNASARSLALNKTQSIGVGLYNTNYIMDPYFSTIINSVCHIAGDYNYNLHFTITDKKMKGGRKNLHYMRKIDEKYLDGLIIIDQCISNKDILELKKINFPFVLMDRDIPGQKINCVMTDNREGIFKATEHLIKLGHQKIGFMVEAMKFYRVKEMLKGYKQALNQYDLAYEKSYVRESSREKQKLAETVEELMQLPQRPTAIITSCDQIAMETLMLLKNKGLSIPRDMALIGYDDNPLNTYAEPSLTTVRVPIQKMGELAAERLIGVINNENITEKRRIVLKPELVIRKSSGGKVK